MTTDATEKQIAEPETCECGRPRVVWGGDVESRCVVDRLTCLRGQLAIQRERAEKAEKERDDERAAHDLEKRAHELTWNYKAKLITECTTLRAELAALRADGNRIIAEARQIMETK